MSSNPQVMKDLLDLMTIYDTTILGPLKALQAKANKLFADADNHINRLTMENAQAGFKVETLVDVVSMQIQNEGISRTFSAPLPPQSRL